MYKLSQASGNISGAVKKSLQEDIGEGDITAALIPKRKNTTARIITRESGILCGIPWVNEVYHQLNPGITINWQVNDGNPIKSDQTLAILQGNARDIVTGERTALNWLQTLSGTATKVAHYVHCLERYRTTLLDTRKTLPGLRFAQKYAVRCGGGQNHRMGLYDAFLIKENHIISCDSITNAIFQARLHHPKIRVEVEVENKEELREAIHAKADIILLDNFSKKDIRAAVKLNAKQPEASRAKLEISGNVEQYQSTLQDIAATGVDYISVGALTKHVRALDLSMRLENQ